MRFSYAETMCDPSFYVPLARAAEAAGYDTYVVPDSVCYPQSSVSRYPYTADGERDFLEDKPFIEPFSLVAAMAAVTSMLRFATFVLKLPIRSPVLVAKQVTSTAVLSDGRFSLGIGTSPWREDYDVTFQPWEKRGKRADEMLDIIEGLGTGEYFEYHGEIFDLPPVKLCPVPDERVPILVGGHSSAALARAARWDGWMHAGGSTDEIASSIERLRALRADLGRSGEPFSIFASSADSFHLDGVRRLEELGVTDLVLAFRYPYTTSPDTESLDDKIRALEGYAERVIAKL